MMFIRYQWVRNGAVGLGVLGAVYLVYGAVSQPASQSPRVAPRAVHAAGAVPAAATSSSAVPAARSSLDARVIQIASGSAQPNARIKDALGRGAPWKVNLYEDTGDQVWDRAKVDHNRDDVWDENWTFKKGRWEKDGGRLVWGGSAWVESKRAEAPQERAASVGRVDLDARVIQIASGPAEPNGRIKDALGAGAPWKVNLYEDSGDRVWDRAKVDHNRDDVWDESWTFKKGRWEKDGGRLVWGGAAWVAPGERAAAPAAAEAEDPLVHAANVILNERAPGAKNKDLFNGRGPKVNLYDDDGDGRWDRAKVDHDRDDVWNESWTRKGDTLERKLVSTGQILLFSAGDWTPK